MYYFKTEGRKRLHPKIDSLFDRKLAFNEVLMYHQVYTAGFVYLFLLNRNANMP